MSKNNSASRKKLVSIVIPCYNEEKNIERFEKELIHVCEKFKDYSFEYIAVDDGSTKDLTWERLEELSNKHDNFISIKHTRNYGMSGAYQTGFDVCSGDFVITYSSDLEIPASHIKDVIEELENGADFVNTLRTGRWQESLKGSLVRRLPSNIAQIFIQKISGLKIKDNGSGLKGFRKFIIENLRLYGEMHRFMPAYSSVFTKNIKEIPVEYKDRTYGTSNYGSLKRTISVFLDLFTLKFMLTFSTKPFTFMPGRAFGSSGFFVFSLGFTILTYVVVYLKLILNQNINDRPLFFAGLILLVTGLQLMMTGLIGELLMRSYFEGSGRKAYIVRQRLN
jgi:glycosyltransferase involved in cell wall biosynthesis